MISKLKYTEINGKYDLLLPEHRANRPEWAIKNGGWEVERIESMLGDLKEGDTVFDIGTEEGDISALLAKKVGRSGEIVLVEPNPRVWPNIKAIWDANGLKNPLACFVGFASSETRNYTKPDNSVWPQCAYGEIISDHGFKELWDEGRTLPQIKIDHLCQGTVTPDLITIDVEGAELEVLKGATELLKSSKPIVYVSVHPEFMKENYGYESVFLFKFMWGLGYKHKLLDFDHEYQVKFTYND